jgi:hypothetical protein
VAIRARKPCVLARRRLLGWKVRLLTVGSPSGRPGAHGERPGKGGRRCSRYAGRNRRPARRARACESGRRKARSRVRCTPVRVKPAPRLSLWTTGGARDDGPFGDGNGHVVAQTPQCESPGIPTRLRHADRACNV